jgi:hypothetical protein
MMEPVVSASNPRSVLRRPGIQAKPVGSFVAKLTGKAFEKYGFSTVMLLTDWAAIVGKDLAAFTLPERLKWPRNVDVYGETAPGERGRPGATLVLRVDGARALDVQFQSAQLIERINAYFGYQAVTELRFIQAPVTPPKASPIRDLPTGPRAEAPSRTASRTTGQTNDGRDALAAALARLEASVLKDTTQVRNA